MNRVELAERHRKVRAAIFAGGAATLLITQGVSMATETYDRPFWLLMATGFALWLTPLIGWLGRHRPLTSLLEDELTQLHRRSGFTAGFWAATGSAALLALVAPITTLTVGEAARIIVTAGLVGALGCFALLEWRGDT